MVIGSGGKTPPHSIIAPLYIDDSDWNAIRRMSEYLEHHSHTRNIVSQKHEGIVCTSSELSLRFIQTFKATVAMAIRIRKGNISSVEHVLFHRSASKQKGPTRAGQWIHFEEWKEHQLGRVHFHNCAGVNWYG
jgi:hypothetical protein